MAGNLGKDIANYLITHPCEWCHIEDIARELLYSNSKRTRSQIKGRLSEAVRTIEGPNHESTLPEKLVVKKQASKLIIAVKVATKGDEDYIRAEMVKRGERTKNQADKLLTAVKVAKNEGILTENKEVKRIEQVTEELNNPIMSTAVPVS